MRIANVYSQTQRSGDERADVLDIKRTYLTEAEANYGLKTDAGTVVKHQAVVLDDNITFFFLGQSGELATNQEALEKEALLGRLSPQERKLLGV